MAKHTRESGVSVAYARSVPDYLRQQGLNPDELYSAKRMAEIEAMPPGSLISLHEWDDMLDVAVAASGDPELPLKVGQSQEIWHLGLFGYVAMSSSTLEDAIGQLVRYGRLILDVSHTRLAKVGDKAEIHCVWPNASPPSPAVQQVLMSARLNWARWLVHMPDYGVDAYFQFKRPLNVDIYRQVFRGNIFFDQAETKLVFPLSFLGLPVMTANVDSRRLMEAQAEAVLKELSDPPGLLRELKLVLSRGLAAGNVTLDHAAAGLDMSTRTLRRRLKEQGCSFQQVLDELRRERAEAYLRESEMPISQIAFLLGYSEQSPFQQAFKRWTGITPGEFRMASSRN